MDAEEGNRSRWGGWTSNPVEAAKRSFVGSTPTPFRHRSGRDLIAKNVHL